MDHPRLNRLFNPQARRCFHVAIDHGFFNEKSFLGGIENLSKAVETLVAAAPDAIQLTLGQARHLQRIPVRATPDAAVAQHELWAVALASQRDHSVVSL